MLTLRGACHLAQGLEEFISCFARKVVAPTSILLKSPESYTRHIMTTRAKFLGHDIDPVAIPDITKCFCTSQAAHYNSYEAVKKIYAGADGSYYYDVDQNSKVGTFGPYAPCLVSHGLLVDSSAGTLLGGLHHLALQGVSVWPELTSDLFDGIGVSFPDLLANRTITENNAKDLAGNAIFEPLLGYLLFWLVANVVVDGAADASVAAIDSVTMPAGASDAPRSSTSTAAPVTPDARTDTPNVGDARDHALPSPDTFARMDYFEFRAKYGHLVAAGSASSSAASSASGSRDPAPELPDGPTPKRRRLTGKKPVLGYS